jgi:hypothetical protein
MLADGARDPDLGIAMVAATGKPLDDGHPSGEHGDRQQVGLGPIPHELTLHARPSRYVSR